MMKVIKKGGSKMETALFYISKPLLSRLPPLRGMVSTKGELYPSKEEIAIKVAWI